MTVQNALEPIIDGPCCFDSNHWLVVAHTASVCSLTFFISILLIRLPTNRLAISLRIFDELLEQTRSIRPSARIIRGGRQKIASAIRRTIDGKCVALITIITAASVIRELRRLNQLSALDGCFDCFTLIWRRVPWWPSRTWPLIELICQVTGESDEAMAAVSQ